MAIALSPEQSREIGSLLLSAVQVDGDSLWLRAAQWRNTLARVGIAVPFFAVADLGVLLVAEPGAIGPRRGLASGRLSKQAADSHRRWVETLRELSASEVCERARGWRLPDDLVCVVLLRALAPIWERHLVAGRRPIAAALPLDPEVYADSADRLPGLFAASDRTSDLAFLDHLAKESLRLVTAFEQIDLDTLRLLGMLGAEASAASAFGMLDLLGVLGSPEANDVVNFSLDLIPSVLETKRATGAQTFAVDGYAGLERRGTIDSLVLSELAQDEDLFDARYIENDVFHYARERRAEEERRLHYIVCDATASMRGQRAVFARGLLLTLIKKLELRGEDVFFRFFDSRLYDLREVRPRRRGQSGIDIPYILSFRGEHGRNYAKVFGILAADVARVAAREKRTPVVYVLTHAECHVPVPTIERLAQVASIYGIFMLPSAGKLDLEYLSRLATVQIVDESALEQRDARAERAMAIIDDAAGERASGPPSGPGRRSIAPTRADDLAAAERELERYLSGGGQ